MSERELFAGIDPGNSGAIAILDEIGLVVDVCKFDNTEADIAESFRAFAPFIRMAYLEWVHSMPGQGVASTFTFGRSYGFLHGLLVALQIPFEEVRPIKWQTGMGCLSGGDKRVTKAAAQRLFPRMKITHATADSILIAEFCRRKHTNEDRRNIQSDRPDNEPSSIRGILDESEGSNNSASLSSEKPWLGESS